MGTLELKWGPNGDPKTEKGPHGDRVPQMGTHVGTVQLSKVKIGTYSLGGGVVGTPRMPDINSQASAKSFVDNNLSQSQIALVKL